MTFKRATAIAFGLWALIALAHGFLNYDWGKAGDGRLAPGKRKFTVAYIPVTCHLTCPVTDFISSHTPEGNIFIPRKFQGFPEIKEALISNSIQAAFMVAPMAIALRAQGVPVRIVYLGHRYGSSVVVGTKSGIRSVRDLVGRTIAVPNRFSDEYLIVLRALEKNGLDRSAVKILEMAPPDVAGALAVGVIDGFSMGEPFPAQAEMGGYGRILFQAREYWPDYMSCVLVVRQDMIDHEPGEVQRLVDGIARSGLWLDQGVPHRDYASNFVGKLYYNQSPDLLRWALTSDLQRVVYSQLTPRKADFDLVRDLMLKAGTLQKSIEFADYTDVRFAEGPGTRKPWEFERGQAVAR